MSARLFFVLLVLVVLALLLAVLLPPWGRSGLSDEPTAVAPTTTSTAPTTTTTAPPPTTVAPTTTTPTVRPASASRPAAAGEVPDIIRRAFSRFGAAVAEQAVRVAGCETGRTYNPTVVNSSGHTGLFQLSPRYHSGRAARLGFTWAQMREALPNALVAADLFGEQGWRPWTCRYAA